MFSQEQDKILRIYYEIDEFVKVFDNQLKSKLLLVGEKLKTRGVKSHLSISEILTIVIYFHHAHLEHSRIIIQS